jgi:hypothetical protein
MHTSDTRRPSTAPIQPAFFAIPLWARFDGLGSPPKITTARIQLTMKRPRNIKIMVRASKDSAPPGTVLIWALIYLAHQESKVMCCEVIGE